MDVEVVQQSVAGVSMFDRRVMWPEEIWRTAWLCIAGELIAMKTEEREGVSDDEATAPESQTGGHFSTSPAAAQTAIASRRITAGGNGRATANGRLAPK